MDRKFEDICKSNGIDKKPVWWLFKVFPKMVKDNSSVSIKGLGMFRNKTHRQRCHESIWVNEVMYVFKRLLMRSRNEDLFN